MANPYLQVSRDAQQYLTEFSRAFDAAFVAATPTTWARDFGHVNSSRAIQTKYPLPISAAGYKEKKGQTKFRGLFERSLTMQTKEWEDAIAELASRIEAPDFIGWTTEPQKIALEGARHANVLTAEMLKANPLLDLYKEEDEGGTTASTIRLFASNHPVHIYDSAQGTFDNDLEITGFDATSIKLVKQYFAALKAPNGRKAGRVFNTLLIPSALAEQAKDFFESDNLILAVENAVPAIVGGVPTNNRHKGTVRVVECPELLDDDVCYALDATSMAFPWVLQDGGAPEQIIFGKDDYLYKTEGKVGIAFKLQMAVAAALPQTIARLTIA